MAESIEYQQKDNLTHRFEIAVEKLPTITAKLDNDTLLLFYAYYKQATVGSCNTSKPSWYDVKGKAKWEAWNKLGKMASDEAKSLYIELIEKFDPDFETNTTKQHWVSVSTMQNDECPDSDKVLVDFIREGNREKVQNLLDKSLINQLDSNGLGLIHWAADLGRTEMIDLLLENGANINLQDSEGQTPLHYACSCGHLVCVKYLIEKGADKNVQDNEQMSALDVAMNDAIKELFI